MAVRERTHCPRASRGFLVTRHRAPWLESTGMSRADAETPPPAPRGGVAASPVTRSAVGLPRHVLGAAGRCEAAHGARASRPGRRSLRRPRSRSPTPHASLTRQASPGALCVCRLPSRPAGAHRPPLRLSTPRLSARLPCAVFREDARWLFSHWLSVIVALNYLRHRRAHSGPEGPRASGRVTASRSTVSGLGHPTPPPALESRGSPRGPAALGGRRAQTRTCSPAVSLLPPLPRFFPHTEPRKRAVHTPAMRTGTRTPARPDTRVQTGARRHTLPRWELQATPAPPCPGLPARLSPASGRPSSRENRALHTNAPAPHPVYARPQPRPTDPLTGVRSCVLSLLPASSRLGAWATWAAAAPRRHQLRPHRPLEWCRLETVLLTSA